MFAPLDGNVFAGLGHIIPLAPTQPLNKTHTASCSRRLPQIHLAQRKPCHKLDSKINLLSPTTLPENRYWKR